LQFANYDLQFRRKAAGSGFKIKACETALAKKSKQAVSGFVYYYHPPRVGMYGPKQQYRVPSFMALSKTMIPFFPLFFFLLSFMISSFNNLMGYEVMLLSLAIRTCCAKTYNK